VKYEFQTVIIYTCINVTSFNEEQIYTELCRMRFSIWEERNNPISFISNNCFNIHTQNCIIIGSISVIHISSHSLI